MSIRIRIGSNWRGLGALTNTLDEVENHPRLLRSLSWGNEDYDGLALTFLRKMIGPNGENLHVVMDCVAEKCPCSGENVSSVQRIGRKNFFSPNIFQIPNVSVDPNLISVMMPFRSELSVAYGTIKAAAATTGFDCKRVDDIWDDSTVIQDVFSLIFQSYIVVCDFTGKNPNVFYETGIAHALGKHVVPVTQSENDIPFNLKHHRYAKYLNNGEGRERLKEDLISRFRIGFKAQTANIFITIGPTRCHRTATKTKSRMIFPHPPLNIYPFQKRREKLFIIGYLF